MSFKQRFNKLTDKYPIMRTPKFWVIAVIIFFAVGGILNLAGIKPTTTTSAPNSITKSQTKTAPEPAKSTPQQGQSLTTANGLSFKITKVSTLKFSGKDGTYYNTTANIQKTSAGWHEQVKDIIRTLKQANPSEPIAVSVVDSTKTDLANWNIGDNKTILYTYPVAANESEMFEL